jgi:hypothetical protein
LVTADHTGRAQALANVMHCKMTFFSITYLGLPLSDKKLKRLKYLPLIQQEEKRLSGWWAKLLSIEGRLTLLNSVLTAQLVYYMSAFMLSKWVIRRLYQIRHHFLWQGHKTMQKSNRAIRLISWRIVARSKALGDLEVRDLEQMNKLLMLKWMWQWVGDEPDWWKEVTLTPTAYKTMENDTCLSVLEEYSIT